MTSARVHWLDTNVLIQAKDGPFRFSVAPAFWSALEKQTQIGTIRVPKMVYDEIVADEPKDDLARWIKLRRNNGFCVPASEAVQTSFAQIADHVMNKYEGPFAAEFLRVADPWVIAHAMESNGTVITFETTSFGAKRVKIPNVCADLNVARMNLYDMLQSLGIKFT
jgi:hypothetical protein